jgi:hypothetical protein
VPDASTLQVGLASPTDSGEPLRMAAGLLLESCCARFSAAIELLERYGAVASGVTDEQAVLATPR